MEKDVSSSRSLTSVTFVGETLEVEQRSHVPHGLSARERKERRRVDDKKNLLVTLTSTIPPVNKADLGGSMNGVVRRQIHTEGRSDGSRTQTIHDVPTTGEGGALAGPSTGGAQSEPQGVLRLRGGHSSARRVVWTEDTVDNEGLGRKKSKSEWEVCQL